LSRISPGAPGARSPSGTHPATAGSMIAPNGRPAERVARARTRPSAVARRHPGARPPLVGGRDASGSRRDEDVRSGSEAEAAV